MDELVDFSSCPENPFRAFGGGNGRKISVSYKGTDYLLKFLPRKIGTGSYKNSAVSEYLGCHVFNILNIPAQSTILGFYEKDGQRHDVVACKDFNANGFHLMEFDKLKNSCFHSSSEGKGVELTSILEAIDEQSLVSKGELKRFFWDMFIVDAFIGNFDRHNGNWGLLVNEELRMARIAPVYDCGSCLYPQANERDKAAILADEKEIENRVFVFPTSAVKEENVKINYFDFISSLKNPDCNKALLRIAPRIKFEKISELINNTPSLSDLDRKFYLTMLKARKERILDFSLERLRSMKIDQKMQRSPVSLSR